MAAPPSRAAPPARIRAVALGVIRRGGSVLVARERDRVTGQRYHRPPGGGVEFGERAEDALRRELAEELGLACGAVRLLGVIENLFAFEGRPGHEIVFVFRAEPADPAFLERDAVPMVEHDGTAHETAWLPLDRLDDPAAPVYPPGLSDLVREDDARMRVRDDDARMQGEDRV